MATYNIVQLDPAPVDDSVFTEHLKKIQCYLDNYPVGHGDRLILRAPTSRDNVQVAREVEQLVPEAHFMLTVRQPVPARLIRLGKRLRLIQKLGLRYEAIDVEAAARQGVPVAVSSHYGCVVVAEHTLMLMLALSRKLIETHHKTVAAENPRNLAPIYTTQWKRHFNWMGFAEDEFAALYGKTLGIVGLGEIGTEVARRATAFDMRIFYTKRRQLPSSEEQRLGVEFASLNDLLQRSDYVSIHLSHQADTEHLIGERELSLMKPSAFLINTARGNVVDQAALVRALEERTIAGAGLDVFGIEPPQRGDPLLKLKNVVLTPHVAARGPVLARYTRAFENMKRIIESKRPWDVVRFTSNGR